jgi:hypothetical protein
MKISPLGAELLHADGRTDRLNEAKSLFVILFPLEVTLNDHLAMMCNDAPIRNPF